MRAKLTPRSRERGRIALIVASACFTSISARLMLRFGSEGVPAAVIVDASFGLRDGLAFVLGTRVLEMGGDIDRTYWEIRTRNAIAAARGEPELFVAPC